MKAILRKCPVTYFLFAVILAPAIVSVNTLQAQTCPPPGTTSITSNSNTYYPGQQATVSVGSTSIDIGTATSGTPISAGDVLLIIQMQGAQINSSNNITYGDGVSGSGYLNNAELYAGNMEYVIATNSVPLSGGTVALQSGTVNNYKNAVFGTDGQYTYQVIRVPVYYNLTLSGDITPPVWNGNTGGVIVIAVINNLNMNGYSINVSGAGFRGGGAVQLAGGTSTTRDFVSMSPTDANISALVGNHASKGEGIAGTPRLINNDNYASLIKYTDEGYPGGSFGMGAPGNAGGGGSDDNTSINANNSGGGGGGNGGAGGKGGNSYGTNGAYGGYPGALFAQGSALRLVMGGGGGAGSTNNGTGTPSGGIVSGGAAGGGIAIISAGTINSPGFVLANGSSGNSTIVNDASGGGGAGGSIMINAHSGHSNITVYANGGNGGSNFWNAGASSPHGPGGGGGGGVIYSDGTLNAASSAAGGIAGTTNSGSGTINYGAQAGAGGIFITSAVMALPPGCVVLPMKFLTVNGKRSGEQMYISWVVTNEQEITNYIIERSNNGRDFSAAGIVSKKPGNENSNKYNFSDAPAGKEATVYYRIKAQGANGQYFLSKVVTLQADLGEGALTISPVPAIGHTTISWVTTGNNKLNITLVDVAGHAVLSRQYLLKPGLNELLLTNLDALPAGVYFVKAYDGANWRSGKLVIKHNF